MAFKGVGIDFFTRFDAKGLNKGRKEIDKFTSGVKKFGAAVGLAFSTTAIIAFGKSSVKAFLADDKAAKSLAQTLKNTGNAMRTMGVEKTIAALQKQTGVLDDFLRPAFQTLLTATGDVSKSTQGLTIALDVAAGTSKDLETVTQAIAKAYAGNTAALGKLTPGIDKAVLASKDLNKINKELTRLFGGQANTAAKSYAGQLAILSATAADAKETIGKGLVESLLILGRDNNISTATDKMDSFAESTRFATIGLATLLSKLNSKPSSSGRTFFDDLKRAFGGVYIEQLVKLGQSVVASKTPSADKSASANLRGSFASDKLAKAAELKRLKEAAALRALENKSILDKLKATADQKTLDDLKKKLDTERISLTYAMSQATDEATRLQLKGQLDLLDGNARAAAEDLKRMAELADAKEAAEKRMQERTDLTAKAFDDLNIKSTNLIKSIDPLTTAFDNLKINTNNFSQALLDAIKAQNEGERHGAAGVFVPGGIMTNTPQNIPVGGGSGSENSGGGISGNSGGTGGGSSFSIKASDPVDEVIDIVDYWAEQTRLTLAAMAENIANTPIELQIYGDLNDYGFQYAVQRANQANARDGVSIAGSSSTE